MTNKDETLREKIEGILTNGHNNKVHIEQLLVLFAQQMEEVLDELNENLHVMIWTNSPRDKEKVLRLIRELKKGGQDDEVKS